MRQRAMSLDDLDVLIVRTVVNQPGVGIPDVMAQVNPSIPQNTIRNRIRRLSGHKYLQTEKVLNRYYLLYPGPKSAEVAV